MSFVSRLTQSISRTSRDSIALSRAVYGAVLPGKRSHPTSLAAASNASFGERIKTVLLQEARREPSPNSMAISFLKIDKEIGLVKYWGLAEYLRQNRGLFSFSSLSSRLLTQKADTATSDSTDIASTDENDSSQKAANNSATAKVAFMITSSMKRDLVDGLGYQASVVKGMTPQQASLVLHHRLAPDSYEEQISELETAFAEEQQRQREELEEQQRKQQELEAQQKRQEELEESNSQESSETFMKQTEIDSDVLVRSTTSLEESNDASPLLLSSALSNESEESSSSLPSSSSGVGDFTNDKTTLTKIENDTDAWYEVVEIKEEGAVTNEFRQGLYKDHKEAVLGLETRQYIQRKRDEETKVNKTNRNEESSDAVPRVTFVLRSVSGKDLD